MLSDCTLIFKCTSEICWHGRTKRSLQCAGETSQVLLAYSKALHGFREQKAILCYHSGYIAVFISVSCPFQGLLRIHVPIRLLFFIIFLSSFPSPPPSVHHLFIFATIPGTVVGSVNNLAQLILTAPAWPWAWMVLLVLPRAWGPALPWLQPVDTKFALTLPLSYSHSSYQERERRKIWGHMNARRKKGEKQGRRKACS